jgi:hypothetical protein
MVEKLYNQDSTLVKYSGFYLHLVAVCIPLILLCTIALSSAVLPPAGDESSKLKELISGNEDPLVNANDLAYFLVIHDFDARPKDDYVEVYLDGAVYKLVPNGSCPGLANITMVDK